MSSDRATPALQLFRSFGARSILTSPVLPLTGEGRDEHGGDGRAEQSRGCNIVSPW